MTKRLKTDRRTVLKTFGAGIVGGSALVGTTSATPPGPPARKTELEIVGRHDHDTGEHFFDLSSNTIDSGWTTVVFDNQTQHTHFTSLLKLPEQAIIDVNDSDLNTEGLSILEFYVETVTRPFQWFYDGLIGNTQDDDDLQDIYPEEDLFFGLFAPWFADVAPYGGPGLTTGPGDSMSTMGLVPGEYIVECYVKDSAEDFHSYLGMIEHLSVTDTDSGEAEPTPTLDLSLSNENGISLGESFDEVNPGRHVIEVTVESQQIGYGNLVGHDLHLLQYDGETTRSDLNDWMSWIHPGQLVTDGTEPATFLGGIQDMWPGSLPQTGYVHVGLGAGEYALVSENPNPDGHNLLKEFSVSPQRH